MNSIAGGKESELDPICYSITGRAAHLRIKPLLPAHWKDCSPYSHENNDEHCAPENDHHADTHTQKQPKLKFIWENAPRNETKTFRDTASCYSHLPSGMHILDDKWILGRLLTHEQRRRKEGSENDDDGRQIDDSFAPLETHFFRGRSGLEAFHSRMQSRNNTASAPIPNTVTIMEKYMLLEDLDPEYNIPSRQIMARRPDDTWVIKDANSNGFGGVWIMNIMKSLALSSSASMLLDKQQSPLCENHRYVAQEYTWPPVLYQRRKCHIRVYAVMMNGRAYVHKRCFLHVANEEFLNNNDRHDNNADGDGDSDGVGFEKHETDFDPAVHITNCCANSHDPTKFAGEILADLFLSQDEPDRWIDGQKVVPLAKYYKSIAASVQVLAKNAMSYVQGGEGNCGFEYLGLDFILSHGSNDDNNMREPIAYLLEVNCPPSQDTATGLGFAEELHDEVLRDLMRMWVVPAVEFGDDFDGCPEETFGWDCVYRGEKNEKVGSEKVPMIPSKAAILNKIRWGIFERRAKKADDTRIDCAAKIANEKDCSLSPHEISALARKQFPYFDIDPERKSQVFLENAGGSQVPSQVIDSMVQSLSHRHRSVIGQTSKDEARKVTMTLLGGSQDMHRVFLGYNASSLFESLSRCFVYGNALKESDEIILASENHTANVIPWIKAASETGAKVLWWTTRMLPHNDSHVHSSDLNELLTVNTRLVCLSHASNILGSVRDIRSICQNVRQKCPRAHIIVDGVAAAPHINPAVDYLGVDWYCVSFHKLFGPHLGAMIGKISAINDILPSKHSTDPHKFFENGTMNYEGCNGVKGLGRYMSILAELGSKVTKVAQVHCLSRAGDDPIQRCKMIPFDLSRNLVCEAYRRIKLVEKEIMEHMMQFLAHNPLVRIIGDENRDLPIFSFVHQTVSSKNIVDHCYRQRVCIRCGSFLTTTILQEELGLRQEEFDIVRISFCHYNNMDDVRRLVAALEKIEHWQ